MTAHYRDRPTIVTGPRPVAAYRVGLAASTAGLLCGIAVGSQFPAPHSATTVSLIAVVAGNVRTLVVSVVLAAVSLPVSALFLGAGFAWNGLLVGQYLSAGGSPWKLAHTPLELAVLSAGPAVLALSRRAGWGGRLSLGTTVLGLVVLSAMVETR